MAAKKPARPLPPDVTEADTRYPERPLSWERQKELGLTPEAGWSGRLVFYRVGGASARRGELGWVLTTLLIGHAGSRARAAGCATDRSYGIGVADGKVYRVGRGPHVTDEVEVHVSEDNVERLGKYLELWRRGMADAGAVRDRISSRRAQGQLYRQQGRTSWTW